MSILGEDIYNFLNDFAPLSIAESQDNSGLQVGNLKNSVTGILLTVDVTLEAIKKAKNLKSNLIISHHPLIFSPLYQVSVTHPKGELVYELIKNDITLLSWHTPLDKIKDGVSEAIVRELGYQGSDFVVSQELDGEKYGFGRVVYLEKSIKLQDLAKKLQSAINDWVMIVGEEDSLISSFAVCGGSGAFLIQKVKEKGISTLVTSDVKYHTAKDCELEGFNLVLMDHSVGESLVLKYLKTKLEVFTDFDVPVTLHLEKSPFKLINK